MTRRQLPRVEPEAERLGAPTIMDRALAARHGVPYVHLAAFAIDIDRLRQAAETLPPSGAPLPFGWDVFLTERRVVAAGLDDKLLEDVVLGILEGRPDALGTQLTFAVFHAVERGALPASLAHAFRGWAGAPEGLAADLAPFWADPAAEAAQLASRVVSLRLAAPLAPPTEATLRAWAES